MARCRGSGPVNFHLGAYFKYTVDYGWPSYSQLIIFTSSKNIFTSSKNIFTGSRNKTPAKATHN